MVGTCVILVALNVQQFLPSTILSLGEGGATLRTLAESKARKPVLVAGESNTTESFTSAHVPVHVCHSFHFQDFGVETHEGILSDWIRWADTSSVHLGTGPTSF